MLVKCRLCSTKIERNQAFKVVVGGKNAYYCNEAEYQQVLHDREVKDSTYECVNRIFGYKVLNSALFKEMNIILESYSYDYILAYLKDNEEYITNVLKKDFNSEYAKIRYFSAILKNNLQDYHMPIKEEPRVIEYDEPIVHKFHRSKQRRGLAELESEV